jgi:hypothetical protein
VTLPSFFARATSAAHCALVAGLPDAAEDACWATPDWRAVAELAHTARSATTMIDRTLNRLCLEVTSLPTELSFRQKFLN